MKKIEILDCTLRDGGYVNNNTFGYENIKTIIAKLEEANIDIIECGYLSDTSETYSKDVTDYNRMEELQEQNLIDSDKDNHYTLMLLGEKYQIEHLPNSRNSKNNIIRMTFHKHKLPKAIEYAKEIVKKGYRLFLQPTVIMNYKEDEIIAMIEEFNKLDVMGVAIVDTFGQMLPEDTVRITKMFDQHLRKDIKLAFHAHNNFQMAFSNAISFINTTNESRNIVIDTSLCGMGRGAGNLPTELLANYLNENFNKNYQIDSLLEVSDTIIEKIKQEYPWGYSLPYYLSAKYACHPSYVLYLLNKKMLDSTSINQVLQMISSDKRTEYDKEYIEELYLTYSEQSIDDLSSYNQLKNLLLGKEVVVIGPGKSIIDYHGQIEKYINDHNCFIITVNNPELYNHDAVFYSNKKRYYSVQGHMSEPLEIITSNIDVDAGKNKIIFDYSKSLSRKGNISDSAILVLLSILQNAEVPKVVLAGFDGYSSNVDSYYNNAAYILDQNYVNDLNQTMRKNIKLYQKQMQIISLTPSKNIDTEEDFYESSRNYTR